MKAPLLETLAEHIVRFSAIARTAKLDVLAYALYQRRIQKLTIQTTTKV